MNILFLCHDLPNPSNPVTFRVYHTAKYLAERYNYDITIAAFKEKKHEDRYTWHLEDFSHLKIVEIPEFSSPLSKLIYVTLNMLSPHNLLSKHPALFNYYYSPRMHRAIEEALKEGIDVVFLDLFPLIPYVINQTKLPKVIEVWAEGDAYHGGYKSSKGFRRIYYWLIYNLIRRCENKYSKFNACITVTTDDREKLERHFNLNNIHVIPYGIDIEHFKPADIGEKKFPNLVFVGNMRTGVNEHAIIYFYEKIFPLIQKEVPYAKLYIVGKDPGKKILELASDSVIITGYIGDVKPYYDRASVVILPLIKSYGFRTRALEAMAMEKPIVATSTAVRGIDITPEENIIIVDGPEEFAERVIQLLEDKELRNKIGKNARRLIEEKYSWKATSEKLHEVLLSTRV